MRRTGKVGIARVVVSTRQHLAALMPTQQGLVLELLRWVDEVRDTAGLQLPSESDTTISERELKMAEQLVGELEDDWKPEAFHDEFRDKLQQLVEEKVRAGEGEHIVKPLEGEEVKTSADIIDLTELLRRSLQKGGKAAADDEPRPVDKPAKTRRKDAANDEEARPRRAAATKSSTRASTSAPVKPRPGKKKAA
jgi:DNA end-binding protein Ku